MHNRLLTVLRRVVVAAFLTVLLGACADGFAPTGDDDDEKFDEIEGAAAPSRTPEADNSAAVSPNPTRVPTSTPDPTATPQPTATPEPTATPSPTPTATATPTPTPTPMFPPELSTQTIRAVVGESVEAVIADDPDSDVVGLQILENPGGVSEAADDSLRFEPTEAGRFTARVRVVDSQGLVTIGDIALEARFAGHPQALVALGDSVPAGHGLDLSDYLGDDPCWRAPNSFPRRVFDQLVDNRVFPEGQAEFALLACSGYDVDDLWEREVTGGFGDITPADGRRSQLDWAVRSNPRFVTMTIGANDTGFVGPSQLFLEDGELDRDQVARRLFVIDRDLRVALDTLVDGTDATIFVTNYYDPTAENPQGIAICRTECFRAASREVVQGMNDVIESVATSYPADRVVFVDVATSFVGKGAPNGIGPDGFREDGFGSLGELVGADQIEGVHPYCARGETVGASWINPVDCVHPDERGTAQLAQLLFEAIQSHVEGQPEA